MAKKRRNEEDVEAPDQPLRLVYMSPSDLADNVKNWRCHPQEQISALTDVISEVGWAGACLYNEETGRLIDGHARRKVALEQGAEKIPVLVGRWSPEQEATILSTLDPIGAMATADKERLDALLREVKTGDAAVQQMLTELVEKAGVIPAAKTELRPVDTQPPPTMSWVLVGIPTVRFGEIAGMVEQIAAVPDVLLETVVNDGEQEDG